MGKLFTTGWERKPRDKDGKIIREAPKVENKPANAASTTAEGMQTMQVKAEKTAEAKTSELAKMVTATDAATEATGAAHAQGEMVIEGTRIVGS
jgi:hypothetical protein